MRRRLPQTLLRQAALAIIIGLIVASCSLPGNVTGSRTVTATFEDVGDLVVGHSVQVADVRIGSVTEIELTDDYRAMVTMSLKDGVFIPTESEARLRTTSLLGEKFIELRPLDQDNPTDGTSVSDGHHFDRATEAPELEFVAEQAIEVLGAVLSDDVATLVETGAEGFGGRGAELASLVDDLSTVSGTLAEQTDELVRIIDALDDATGTLASGSSTVDQLLTNLADTAVVLADNRDEALEAVREMTRLAQVQNNNIFEPYFEQVDTQISQLDAILGVIDRDQQQVRDVLFWLAEFTDKLPAAAPGDFAQVAGLFELVGVPLP